jgi:hypothetical protein
VAVGVNFLKTLGEKDIEKVMSDLIGKFEKDLGALIRR